MGQPISEEKEDKELLEKDLQAKKRFHCWIEFKFQRNDSKDHSPLNLFVNSIYKVIPYCRMDLHGTSTDSAFIFIYSTYYCGLSTHNHDMIKIILQRLSDRNIINSIQLSPILCGAEESRAYLDAETDEDDE